MPLLTKNKYPADIVDQQQKILKLKGYHVIFDEVLNKINWERDLPCQVQDGLTVCIFLYQARKATGLDRRFRYSVNYPGRAHYVEIADYVLYGMHFVGTKRDHVTGTARRTDLLPNIGDYFWVTFSFDSGSTCKTYFKAEHLDTRNVVYSTLHYIYAHNPYFNGSAVLSFHIVAEYGYSPFIDNLIDKPLAFIFVTATVTVEGTQGTSSSDDSITFEVFEDGTAEDSRDTVSMSTGTQNVDTIVFRILAYGVSAHWGQGGIAKNTSVSGSNEVIVRVRQNFKVNNVIVRTGMYNGW